MTENEIIKILVIRWQLKLVFFCCFCFFNEMVLIEVKNFNGVRTLHYPSASEQHARRKCQLEQPPPSPPERKPR